MNVFFIISTLTNFMYIKLEKCLEYCSFGCFYYLASATDAHYL